MHNSISNDDLHGEQRTAKNNDGTLDRVIHAMLDFNIIFNI